MLTQTDIERERYEARQKAQWDHNSFVWFAEKVGAINAYERLLKRVETPRELLARRSEEDLTRLVEDLEKQVSEHR